LAVMGFVEVLSRLRFLWRLERRIGGLIESGRVDLVVPVNYPGFNLRITERSKAAGVPVVYYIAPQVWAWRAGRAAQLARAADRICVILPFEKAVFEEAGARVEFVGHPLLDREEEVPGRESFCRAAGLDPGRRILALLPGSRRQEVRRHLRVFLDAGAKARERYPDLQVAVAEADGVDLRLPPGAVARVVPRARALLAHAHAAVVKSGTSTLEAALAGVPFVVAYRTHPWTFALARRLVRVEHVALANLVAGRRVVPEFLQDAVTAGGLAGALVPLIGDGPERRRVLAGLGETRERLGGTGASRRVVRIAAEVLEERGRCVGPGGLLAAG
ncbi:MAG: lipid-A-disaccharide synthase, partial [Gemmatimonadetes bacterium]|nr:lipid-A-disaccharide synthase [Gemmatimonadota bacterium]